MKEKGVGPVPPKNERPSNSSTNLRYKQNAFSNQSSVVNLLQDSANSEDKNTKEIVTPLRSRRSSYCSIQNDGNRARISNLLKNLDKNSRKFVLENLRSMDSWNKALVDDESTDSEDSKRNTENFQSYKNPSYSSHDKSIVTTEAARQKMRKKVELRKPKQLIGLQTNTVTQQCRNMREITKKNKLDLVMKEMYKMQLQSELESLNAQAITIPLLHEGINSSSNARKKDQSIQLKAVSCVHAWTLRAINNVMKKEMLKYASHSKKAANQLWAKRLIVRIWRRYKLVNLMDRIVAIQQDEREAYNDSIQKDEAAFRQRIKLREHSEDINSLRLKSSECKSSQLLQDRNNITLMKTSQIKSLCCQEIRTDLAPFSTIINRRIIDGGFNNHISWQEAATVRHGQGQGHLLSAADNRYKDTDKEAFTSSVIKVIEKMSRIEDYESRKKSLCTTIMKPILTIHNIEIRSVQYL